MATEGVRQPRRLGQMPRKPKSDLSEATSNGTKSQIVMKLHVVGNHEPDDAGFVFTKVIRTITAFVHLEVKF
jgi:hypothetical protein